MSLTSDQPSLHYEVRGSGEPLLMINGFGLSVALIAPLVAAGEDRLTWITYDHPGVGRSPRGGGVPYTVAQFADAAAGVLDGLGLESAHVAGMSLGGAIALELALRAPARVRTLHLLGTSAGGPLGRHVSLVGLARTAAQVTVGSVQRRRLWLGPALYSDSHLSRQRRTHRARALPDDTALPSPRALLGQSIAAMLHDRSRRLGRIAAPTLVLHGDRDALLPLANARDLARGIPDAEIHVIAGAGHAFLLERPDEVVALITGFIRRRWRDSPAPPP